MIVTSEENVILRVLSSGQHHIERVQDIVLGGVTDNVRVAIDHSQYEGDNWKIWGLIFGSKYVKKNLRLRPQHPP